MHEVMEGHEGHGGEGMMAVAVTLTILAVFVAVATLLGHRASTDMLALETKVSDQWNFYQAKNIRQHEDEIASKMMPVFTGVDKEKAESFRDDYSKEAERYSKERDDIMEKAKELEADRDRVAKQGDRYDLAEVLLEIAVIVCSLTLLTKKKFFWLASICLGLVGLAIVSSALFLH
jgi:hypothetical protein